MECLPLVSTHVISGACPCRHTYTHIHIPHVQFFLPFPMKYKLTSLSKYWYPASPRVLLCPQSWDAATPGFLCACWELDSDIHVYATSTLPSNSAISPDPSGIAFESCMSSKMTLSNFGVKRPSPHGRTTFVPIALSIKISHVAFAEFPDHHVFWFVIFFFTSALFICNYARVALTKPPLQWMKSGHIDWQLSLPERSSGLQTTRWITSKRIGMEEARRRDPGKPQVTTWIQFLQV